MTEPIRSAGPPSAPTPSTEHELILISARPSDSPSVPIPAGEIALQCLPKFEGVALAAMSSYSSPVVAALASSKALLELGQCAGEVIKKNEEDAAVRYAVRQCAELGGTQTGVVNQQVGCVVPVEVP
jgi:hypothetical protein